MTVLYTKFNAEKNLQRGLKNLSLEKNGILKWKMCMNLVARTTGR